MTQIEDFALSAARKYLQSIVFVDDKIYYEVPAKGVVPDVAAPKAMRVFAKPMAPKVEEKVVEGDAGKDGGAEGLKEDELYHPKNLVESFAREGMVCALYEPAEGFPTGNKSDLFKLCERADVVILDWEFHGHPGTKILPLISNLVSAAQTSVPHHVRLIAVYTSTPDLKRVAAQIYEHLVKTDPKTDAKGEYDLDAGSSRIIVLGKPATGRAQDQVEAAEVAEVALAGRIIAEFAAMHEGILPSMAMHGLASVRTNTKKILDKFRREMDGAFLVHRGLIYPGDDAFEQIPELLSEEALAVMTDSQLPYDQSKRLADEVIESFGLSIDWEVKKNKQKPEPGVLAKKLLKDGLASVEKVVDIDVVAIEQLHAAVDRKSLSTDKRLATLYNIRTLYNARKDLRFGTIVRHNVGDTLEYSICLMPLCDCVRLATNGRVYQFPFWKLRASNEKQPSKGMVIELPSDEGFVELFSMGKPRDQMWMKGFKASSPSKTVIAVERDGKWVFEAASEEQAAAPAVVEATAPLFEFVAQLKPIHAQRIAHDIGASFSRVGVLEAEWLRRKADRR
ncbi:MAG: response regulator receiver domain [Allorhizobium sp.]